ncbi:uncharacterized protein [Miscanthus floridulus]|uniref:uncharacterized protein n=1 Tax=Miscanthus floridulus TaxID=154761 RepID=UPI00345AA447
MGKAYLQVALENAMLKQQQGGPDVEAPSILTESPQGTDEAMETPTPAPTLTHRRISHQYMAQNMQNNGNAPPKVRDKRGEFLKGHLPVFKHSTDPLQADDWLRAVERQLEIAQCDDREKVFAFRSHHVPTGLMKLKKEVLALKQGSMSVAEYCGKFIQLSRYAPTEVEDDDKRQELFMEGHYSNRCPNKLANMQQNYVRGKVNHVTAETAQEAPDVVIGTFPVNSNSATVLFDSGASHSFIAYTFIKKHGIPICVMKKPILVNSPRGEMKANWVCLAASFTIRGVEFEANLIVIDSSGIDVILGMDWLRPQRAVIHCENSSVILTAPSGEKVEYAATQSALEISWVNQLKGTSIKDIQIVNEYPDVFPNELPSMPPE